MPNVDPWKMCADALESLGGRARFFSSEAVFEEAQRLHPGEEISFERVAEELEKNSLRLLQAQSLPIFITDGRGHYVLAREPPEKRERRVDLKEERLKEQVVEDLGALAETLYLSEAKLLQTEYPLDDKRVDIVFSSDNTLWFLELKVDKETGSGVSQVASYIDLARESPSISTRVISGVVIAPRFSSDAKTLARAKGIRLVRYRWGLYFDEKDP